MMPEGLPLSSLKRMRAEVGDAAELHPAYGGEAAAVVSTFGLQQLGPGAPQVWGKKVLEVSDMIPVRCECGGVEGDGVDD